MYIVYFIFSIFILVLVVSYRVSFTFQKEEWILWYYTMDYSVGYQRLRKITIWKKNND
jgi:hypothetical protein